MRQNGHLCIDVSLPRPTLPPSRAAVSWRHGPAEVPAAVHKRVAIEMRAQSGVGVATSGIGGGLGGAAHLRARTAAALSGVLGLCGDAGQRS